jgi:hypothetical protein
MPSLFAPNIDNYFVGKGVVMFKPDGDTHYHFIGNVTEFEFSPTLETLDHFSSMSGVKSKDKTVVLQKGGTVRMVMEELTARNLALFLLGDVDLTDPDVPTIEIFGSNLKSGAMKFIGTNEIGPRWNYDFARVDFVPSGSFNPISDEWGNLEVTGNLAEVDGTFGTATLTNLNNEGPPICIALPSFTSNDADLDTMLSVGDTLTADNGTWLNYGDTALTYAYRWLADGVAIGGATASTYTLTGSEVGSIIQVEVTATNENGSAVAASEPYGPLQGSDVTT